MSNRSKGSRNLSLSSSDDDDKNSFTLRNNKNRSSSRTSTPSSLSNKSNKSEKKNFSRPASSRQRKSSSSSSSSDEKNKSKSNSRTSSSLQITKKNSKKSDSDTDSDSTIKKDLKSDESFDKPRSSRTSDRKKPILRSSSSSSSSSSKTRSRSNSLSSVDRRKNSDSDDESAIGSSISKIVIESKPPINKKSINRKTSSRSSNFDKPKDNSDSDSESKTHSNHTKNSKNETHDSHESDMTDVSSLPSPRETKIRIKTTKKSDDEESLPRGRTAFYSALQLKSQSRPNSVNFNINTYSDSNDYKNKVYERELLRIGSQNAHMLSFLLKENEGRRRIERPFRPTSSAINRQREQQRIEKENQLILKRLLSVKSTKEVRKENQLRDYEKNMGISDLNLSSSTIRSNLSTKRSGKSTMCNSRVSSAKSTRGPFDFSNRSFSLSRRPEWNDRW